MDDLKICECQKRMCKSFVRRNKRPRAAKAGLILLDNGTTEVAPSQEIESAHRPKPALLSG